MSEFQLKPRTLRRIFTWTDAIIIGWVLFAIEIAWVFYGAPRP